MLNNFFVFVFRVICDDGSSGGSSSNVSDFLCRNNIFLFLHAILSHFELTEEQIFSPEDLYLCQDIGKVFRTLSELSHTPKVLKSGVGGFPRKDCSGDKLLKRLKSEKGNYEELEKQICSQDLLYSDSFGQGQGGNSNKIRGQESMYFNEDIYQTIFPPKQPRLSLADISSFATGAGKRNKRKAPIEELLSTEDKYLENLIMVRDVFREKLSLMSSEDKKLVFFLLDDLILLHSDLLFGLKKDQQAKPTKDFDGQIGRVFLNHMPRITHLYSGYCVHLPTAMSHLEHLLESGNLSSSIKKQVQECQAEAHPSTFPLSSHLVIPFQRFLKYHLLLQEILKRTAEDHPDYLNLQLAREEMVKAGAIVNEKKREQEECDEQDRQDESDMRLILSVSSNIKLMKLENGLNLLDYGRLRKTGDIVSYTDSGRSGDYAFLFDLMIVLCHKPKWLQHRYRFREAIKIRDHYLEPLPPPYQSSQPSSSEVYVLRLFSRMEPRRVTLTLVCRSMAEREVWFEALLLAMDTINPSENAKQGHVVQLLTFAEPTDCFQCGKVLQGRFFQGYRCLRCQACLHKKCLSDCACLEVGLHPLKKTNSLMLPTALPDSLERSNSTLSLVNTSSESQNKRHSQIRETVQELQINAIREQENLPLQQQPWYAGLLDVKTATIRLENLPVGTFLIRVRNCGQYALMLKCQGEKPKGTVKSMKIEEEDLELEEEHGKQKVFYLSQARKFASLAKLVSFYRHRDLTENFNYQVLRGVNLKFPYKNI